MAVTAREQNHRLTTNLSGHSSAAIPTAHWPWTLRIVPRTDQNPRPIHEVLRNKGEILHKALSTVSSMPLDTSTYNLAFLRVDGRRWNELRRIEGQIRTQAAADGSSYLEMGNTKIMCVVSGPSEDKKRVAGATGSSGGGAAAGMGGGAAGAGSGAAGSGGTAEVIVSVVVAGFSSVDRKKRSRTDK